MSTARFRGHHWRAEHLAIADNAGGFQELFAPQTADRTVPLIRRQHPPAEFLLVQSLLNRSSD